MVSFSPGWNFAPRTGLKYWNIEIVSRPSRETQFYWYEIAKSMRMLAFLCKHALKKWKNDSHFQPHLKPSYNRQFHLKRISFRTPAETSARGHGISLRVFNLISHSLDALSLPWVPEGFFLPLAWSIRYRATSRGNSREIPSWTLEEKFHMSARP